MSQQSEAHFNQEQAIKDYTELSRLISVGAYTERSAEDYEHGTYPEDGVEESIDKLTELAAHHGLEFWGNEQGGYSLVPMSEETKAARLLAQEMEQACICAQQQAVREMPYVNVGEARLYQYHESSKRWYVEVDLQHSDPEEGAAIALYRVWKTADGTMAAMKVDFKEMDTRERDLRQIIEALFQIAKPGAVKTSLWTKYTGLRKEEI
jgi:hypothetical protein